MEIRNRKDGNIITIDDEKWDSLRNLGWDKFWTPMKKELDENMSVAINKTVKNKGGRPKKKKVEDEPIEIKADSGYEKKVEQEQKED